jgi:hypothetical protein
VDFRQLGCVSWLQRQRRILSRFIRQEKSKSTTFDEPAGVLNKTMESSGGAMGFHLTKCCQDFTSASSDIQCNALVNGWLHSVCGTNPGDKREI